MVSNCINENILKKRVVIFAGHYGSGKTNTAVNYAMYLKDKGYKTSICDLDIVNPYFRTKDAEDILKENDITLICSEYANSNVDFPALPPNAYSVTGDKSTRFIIDLGGDDRGALAMGRYKDGILKENDYEMLFVVNKYRPLTRTPDSAIEIMREIESACNMKFTGIINNSNLGDITTVKDVEESLLYADELSYKTKLPIASTMVKEDLYKEFISNHNKDNIFPMKVYIKQNFKI